MRSLIDSLSGRVARIGRKVGAWIPKSDPDNRDTLNIGTSYRRSLFRLAFLSVICGLLLYFAERTAYDHTKRNLEHRTLDAVTQLRVDIEREVAKQVERLRAIAAHVRQHPDLDQRAFAQFASYLVADSAPFTRNVALARDLRVSHVYPVDGNAPALGLAYWENMTQWPMVARSLATNLPILTSPLELVQGGQGLIAHIPIHESTVHPGGTGFWGVVSIVIDLEGFLDHLGLTAYREDFFLSITGPTPAGDGRATFVGGDADVAEPVVSSEVRLPNTNWVIRAAPAAGWPTFSDHFGAILVVVVSVFVFGLGLILKTLRFDQTLIRFAHEAEQSRARADAANHAKSIFLANMSHELRTPLNAVLGYTEIMQQRMFGPIGDEKYERYLEDIHKSGRALLGLLDDLLDLSRVETEGHRFDLTCVSIAKALDDALAVCRTGQVDIAVDRACDLTATADKRALKKVLVSVVGNALKHGAGAPIRITCAAPSAETVEIAVLDYGPGISSDILPRVTEAFFTNAASPWTVNSPQGGTGVGLALSHNLVQAMGGDLAVESEPGAWTRVRVRLPRCQGDTYAPLSPLGGLSSAVSQQAGRTL